MACLCRIRQTRVNRLISQLKRSYYHVSAPCLSDYLYQNNLPSNSNRQQIIGLLGSSNGFSVRFFAAPVQSKKKEEANKSKGPRLNEQIKAHMVRLVSDEGHEIVPFNVALDRAKSLNYDLVEVDCNAKPIVCKIMDYHRDRYQQQLKEKERSKNKAESSVRKGPCKEVRISLKIEKKDLEMKADMAKRLMERGYRVKCMVQGPHPAEEDPKARAAMDQKLKGLIERLHALIEDVAFVESGPRVEKSQAFVLVRHIKFGPSKKGGKGAAKSAKSDNEESSSGEFDLGDDLKIACSFSGQEKETVSPSTSRVENIMGPGANSSENRYSRQNVTRAEAEGYMRDRAQMSQPPNFTGLSENRYSRRPPGPVQQQPPPRREIPKQNPTTSDGVPLSTSYGIFSSSSTSLPRNRPPTNDGKSPVGIMNDGNATSLFGSMKTQGRPSAQPIPDSPLTEETEIFSGLFSGDGSRNANSSPFGFKKTQGRANSDSSLKEKTTNPYSGLFGGDGSNVKASGTFPTKPT